MKKLKKFKTMKMHLIQSENNSFKNFRNKNI